MENQRPFEVSIAAISLSNKTICNDMKNSAVLNKIWDLEMQPYLQNHNKNDLGMFRTRNRC